MNVLAGSSLTFSRLPLRQALTSLRQLGFTAVELGALEGWAHISPAAVARDPVGQAEEVRRALQEAGLHAVALNAGLGTQDLPTEEAERRIGALGSLAHALGAAVLTLPGPPWPGGPVLSQVAATIQRLQGYCRLLRGWGVVLAVEGHMGCLTEDPPTAAALCRAVPGLGLTLDPSHYWAGPAQGRGWQAVLPFVAHVHLRDAGRQGWPEIQLAPGAGCVPFPAIVEALRRRGYRGHYAVEYIDTLPVAGGDGAMATAEQAARAMRQLAAGWLAADADGSAAG